MLLRRITEHVRNQNWFAVGLDFVIVVAGVFIGIQVSGWNDTQAEKKAEALIIQRLQLDFEDIAAAADNALRNHKRYLDGLQLIIEVLDRGELADAQPEKFREGLKYSYTHINALDRSATYVEILSSGQLSLIKDEALRKALVSYDNTVQGTADVFSQIRMHQSAHIQAFTRHFTYEVPYNLFELGQGSMQSVNEFDLDSMLIDRDFESAAHQLREMQRAYFWWHQQTKERAQEVTALLDGIVGTSESQ